MNSAQNQHAALFAVLMRLAQLRREPLDPMLLRSSLKQFEEEGKDLHQTVATLAQSQGWPAPKWSKQPDASRLPCIVVSPAGLLGIVTGQDSQGAWAVVLCYPLAQRLEESVHICFDDDTRFVRLRMKAPFVPSKSPSFQLVWSEIWAHKRTLLDIGAGTVAVSLLALVTSFYSMQVYDRVVPTQAMSTLLALTLGVLASIVLEAIGKWVRAHQIHELTDAIDQNLARSIYARFLAVRLDQLPPSIGSTSSRLRSYESIRSFLVNVSTQMLVDLPIAALMLIVLASIGGWLALVPGVFLVLGLGIGLFFRTRIEQLTQHSTAAQHQKLGLLVESIEGAETIKSGQGGWRMLSKWLDLSDEGRQYDHAMRRLGEMQHFLVAMFQQVAYVVMVALGAMYIGHNDFTMGALIACSILSGRITAPIATLPNLITQWAQTRVTIEDLDRLWTYQLDHPEGTEPIAVEQLRGEYQIQEMQMQYQGTTALKIGQLRIAPGERVAILGGVGSGKTSLLRVLSGMYKPQTGRTTLDGLEIDHIAKASLANRMGFVPQDGRLFAGTLRENLVLGLTDPGDDAILEAARKSGLFDAVIAPHPKGLAREIFEGGSGLSGGQRQLVHITRALLRSPVIWLLDEPTASMDSNLEAKVIAMLQAELSERPQSTMVLVTHKPQLLNLVNRVIIMVNQQILMDGPRDQVLQKLQQQALQATAERNNAPKLQTAKVTTE
ncbi:ATP-binding cassette domain-containing protein [Limnohabitans sp.]|uniref:ATP-binding cassette domain-containing protein n=1 Tax=Limnohabitans sp. TaxID=1907725 RepID=UPI00311EE8B8